MNQVTVTVSGRVGSGKSAICGEIEILCKTLGLQVEWAGSQEEKNLTHADWTEALEIYRPTVRIVEQVENAAPLAFADDARDAARYRWIRDVLRLDDVRWMSVANWNQANISAEIWDREIDTAMAATQSTPGASNEPNLGS